MFSWHKGRTTRLRQEVSANGFDYSPLECLHALHYLRSVRDVFLAFTLRSTAL